MHPLKTASLVFWFGLLVFQLSLLWPAFGVSYYWSLPLITMLLLPLPGLITGRIYTYRWIGFLTMLYFCVGISELMANPDLRLYALGTTLFSTLLFFTTIYFARRQASRPRD
jgi:uncharacterized membrane protein